MTCWKNPGRFESDYPSFSFQHMAGFRSSWPAYNFDPFCSVFPRSRLHWSQAHRGSLQCRCWSIRYFYRSRSFDPADAGWYIHFLLSNHELNHKFFFTFFFSIVPGLHWRFRSGAWNAAWTRMDGSDGTTIYLHSSVHSSCPSGIEFYFSMNQTQYYIQSIPI